MDGKTKQGGSVQRPRRAHQVSRFSRAYCESHSHGFQAFITRPNQCSYYVGSPLNYIQTMQKACKTRRMRAQNALPMHRSIPLQSPVQSSPVQSTRYLVNVLLRPATSFCARGNPLGASAMPAKPWKPFFFFSFLSFFLSLASFFACSSAACRTVGALA